METNVWATRGDGQLVWSGTSELIDPGSTKNASRKITDGVVAALAKTGLI